MKRRLPTLCCCLVLSIILSLPALAADSDLILILDASGSMWGQIDGKAKITIAQGVLGGLVDELPDNQQVGLLAYGHRREGDCADIEWVYEPAPLDRNKLKSTAGALKPKGKTPINGSLQAAIAAAEKGERPSTIVLVSDGLETCGGDPCATVRAAKEKGIELVLHVVGFDVSKEDVSQLECVAQAGDGLFLTADNADGLASALDAAVAQTADLPAGGLSVKVTADDELHDASVSVSDTSTGETVNTGRTYTSSDTNPRKLPLAAGTYDVKVKAVGVKGDIVRRFSVTIPEGETVEKEFDFSAGELKVGVTRNESLGDATVNVYPAGETKSVATGRTYKTSKDNPKTLKVTAGTYDVEIKSVELGGDHRHRFEGIVVEPKGTTELSHEFSSGTLKVGAQRGGELIDATVNVRSVDRKRSEGQGRTYKSEKSNPKTFELVPGEYEVTVKEIRGQRTTVKVTVVAGEEVTEMVEIPAGS